MEWLIARASSSVAALLSISPPEVAARISAPWDLHTPLRMTFFLTAKRAALVSRQLDGRSPDRDIHRIDGQDANWHPYRSAVDVQGGPAE
jgi:hypothetical protein